MHRLPLPLQNIITIPRLLTTRHLGQRFRIQNLLRRGTMFRIRVQHSEEQGPNIAHRGRTLEYRNLLPRLGARGRGHRAGFLFLGSFDEVVVAGVSGYKVIPCAGVGVIPPITPLSGIPGCADDDHGDVDDSAGPDIDCSWVVGVFVFQDFGRHVRSAAYETGVALADWSVRGYDAGSSTSLETWVCAREDF